MNNRITVQKTKAKQKRHMQDQMSIRKKTQRYKHTKKEACSFTSAPGG
jgi:hypothetical protein